MRVFVGNVANMSVCEFGSAVRDRDRNRDRDGDQRLCESSCAGVSVYVLCVMCMTLHAPSFSIAIPLR